MGSYVVASAVKAYINGKGMMSSGDLAEFLSKFVESTLDKAIERAKSNDRKTVRGADL